MDLEILYHSCQIFIIILLLNLFSYIFFMILYVKLYILGFQRGVAQSGSASALGAEGRRFKSCLPDQYRHKYLKSLNFLFTN